MNAENGSVPAFPNFDNTTNRTAESELLAAKRQIEAILGGVADGITVVDPRGRFLFANLRAAEMFGLASAHVLMSLRPEEIIAGYEILDDAGNGVGFEELPVRRALRGEKEPQAVMHFRSRTAKEGWWAIAKATPVFADSGDVTFAISTYHDITSQKLAEERQRFLAEAGKILSSSLNYEQTLATVVNVAVPRIADACSLNLLTEDGRLEYLNTVHVDPAKRTILETLRTQFPPDPKRTIPSIQALQRGETVYMDVVPAELLAERAQSAEHLALLRQLGMSSFVAAPLVANRRSIGVLTFLNTESTRRITIADVRLAEDLASRAALAIENARLYAESQRDRREADRANEAKDDFIATVSHELRNPLTAILGWVKVLRSKVVTPELAERGLETIERNAGVQMQLLNDLLDVSQIAKGHLRLEIQSIDLAAVLVQVVDSLLPLAQGKSIEIRTSVRMQPAVIDADPYRMHQIIWNLVSNAVKFTNDGGSVDVRLEQAGSHVRLTVSDTGIGISAQFIDNVFDEFRQEEGSRTRKGGLGLGLAIVRRLVELHGGTVKAFSDGPGHGARFTVEVPLTSGGRQKV